MYIILNSYLYPDFQETQHLNHQTAKQAFVQQLLPGRIKEYSQSAVKTAHCDFLKL